MTSSQLYGPSNYLKCLTKLLLTLGVPLANYLDVSISFRMIHFQPTELVFEVTLFVHDSLNMETSVEWRGE